VAGVLGGPWEGRQGHVLTPPTTPISAFLVTLLGLKIRGSGRSAARVSHRDSLARPMPPQGCSGSTMATHTTRGNMMIYLSPRTNEQNK
jgi:hypothetical protein